MSIFRSFHLNVSASKKKSLGGGSFFLNIAPPVSSSPTEINSHSPQLAKINYTPSKQKNWRKKALVFHVLAVGTSTSLMKS